MDKIEKILTIAGRNQMELATAIRESGECPQTVMEKQQVQDFLRTLAQNSISLEARYRGTRHG